MRLTKHPADSFQDLANKTLLLSSDESDSTSHGSPYPGKTLRYVAGIEATYRSTTVGRLRLLSSVLFEIALGNHGAHVSSTVLALEFRTWCYFL